jgi:hypothetical protein
MLNIIDTFPPGFERISARELHTLCPQPTLIHVEGKNNKPVFLSILLHGNEDVGLLALQRLLRRYENETLPRSLCVFVGNVTAARAGVRRLQGQPDYNRVWPGNDEHVDSDEAALMAELVNYVVAQDPFVSIDMHNNTGLNPHYACVNSLDQDFFHLATMFSRTVVYFLRPRGVQSLAMAHHCPAVTVECGRTGDESGVIHAAEFLHACLNISALPTKPVPPHDLDLFHTIATVKVPPQFSIGFGDEDVDICFNSDLDHLNFREVAAGTTIAKLRGDKEIHLEVVNELGYEVEQSFFCMEGNEMKLCKTLMPSMFTLNKEVIRQDCLGYLMERYPLTN